MENAGPKSSLSAYADDIALVLVDFRNYLKVIASLFSLFEAVSGLAERFFEATGATLHSGAFSDNPASLKVLQRLGSKITGQREIWSVSRGRMTQEITTALTPALFTPYRF